MKILPLSWCTQCVYAIITQHLEALSCTLHYCEAQGKGRAKGRPRKVTQSSFIDGGWWMMDILSLMLYTKFGCHHHLPTVLLLISRIKPSMDQVR